MANADAISNRAGHVFINVDHTEILNVGLITDGDGCRVAAYNAIVPDTRIATERNVADHNGTVSDVGSGMDQKCGGLPAA